METREPDVTPTVVKLGGTTVAADERALNGIADHAARRKLVIVHGGGKVLSAWLERMRIESRFEDGLRVTDDEALEVALAVFGGLVNGELVAALNRRGVGAVGVTGMDDGLLIGERVAGLGRVCRLKGIRRRLIDALLAAGLTPVVAPLALDENGEPCNVNADEAAAGLAAGFGARLLLLTDTDGVLDETGRQIPFLDARTAQRLIDEGAIRDGMLPKVRGALAALDGGAEEVLIANGRTEAAVRRALDGSLTGSRIQRATEDAR